MKFNLLFKLAALCTLSTATIAAPAIVMEQGGDIATGRTVSLNRLDMVSYYKDGKAGKVVFNCFFTGSGVKATLYPGKNFDGNYEMMRTGINGPYMWTLSDKGYTNGNIKVTLLKGDNVTVSCKQIA